MSFQLRSILKAGAVAGAITAFALTSRIATVSATPAHVTTTFAWQGVYDLIGSNAMNVNLRGAGDSLSGEWETSDLRGEIRAARRR